MIVFIAIAALLTLLVLVWLLRPLLRPAPQAGVSSQRLNAAIYRDQLETLERDLARGAISAADHEATRDELQLRLLDDTAEQPTTAPATPPTIWSPRRTAAVIALLLPLGAAGMYWWLGTPQAIDPASAAKAEEDKIMQMVDGLAARLKANPDNPKGWAMLARSYKIMGRLAEAQEAFAKIGPLLDTDPDLLAHYADLLATRVGDRLEGQPMALVNKALALNPLHPMSLMLAGTAAYQQNDYAGAVRHWEKLLPLLEPGSPDAQQMQSNIDEARLKGGMKASPASRANGASTAPAQGQAPDNAQIVQMVEGLAARLKANPGDLEGWARLARSYKVLGRLQEAEEAYVKAGKLLDANPDVLTDYADLLATRAGNQFEGRPLALVNKALALNPQHPMALVMSGTAAYKRGDYAVAVAQWEKLLPLAPPGSREAEWLSTSLADARAKGGLPAPATTKK